MRHPTKPTPRIATIIAPAAVGLAVTKAVRKFGCVCCAGAPDSCPCDWDVPAAEQGRDSKGLLLSVPHLFTSSHVLLSKPSWHSDQSVQSHLSVQGPVDCEVGVWVVVPAFGAATPPLPPPPEELLPEPPPPPPPGLGGAAIVTDKSTSSESPLANIAVAPESTPFTKNLTIRPEKLPSSLRTLNSGAGGFP